jgi:glycine/D-amino acid oxidase-like deaminating enzyme
VTQPEPQALRHATVNNDPATALSPIVAHDFSDRPYWWDAAPPDMFEAVRGPESHDVAIIGSGLTGLRAALDLARGGARVVVLERDAAGAGASRRNAGFLGRVLKKSYSDLARKFGDDYAHRVYSELHEAYASTMAFIRAEGIECYAQECGRFIAATSAAHLNILVEDAEKLAEVFGYDHRVLTADRVREEMGSDAYCGGVVVPDLGSVHPGLYHKGLLDRAITSGVTVRTQSPVTGIVRQAGGRRFSVTTPGGAIEADHLVMATNGYTPRGFSWHARRVIPFTGYMAATEPLSEAMLDELIPRNRTIIDSDTNIDFFRRAPDSPRLLFGGDTGSGAVTPADIARRMHEVLVRAFPQAAGVRLSRIWSGQCAGTFDMMPHLGQNDGIWYGLGYNFAGVPMGTYFGARIADQILNPQARDSIFMSRRFPTAPLYDGNPWFVPLVMKVFDWHDRYLASKVV